MALESPAYVISADSHSAALFRQTAQTMLAGTGVVGSSDLQVTANGTPNMSVNVAAGMVWCPGTLGATSGMPPNLTAQTTYGMPSTFTAQGSYCAYQDGTVNLTIAASNPTNPRIDIVCASIQDAQYAGSTNTPVLQVITGTAAPSPSAPAAPASSVVLAQVAVAANATSITSGNITDVRPFTVATGSGNARRRGAGSSFNLSGAGGVNNPITGWGSDLLNVGNIAYSSGLYTVQDNGVYRWQVSIAWPSTSASYAVWQYVMVNGTIDTGGSNRTQQATGQGTTYYTSGDICQPGPGGTVQAACQASTAGVTGVIPQAFSLYRVA